MLIGKYEFPPYQIFSNIKSLIKLNFDISELEKIELITPKGKKESNRIDDIQLKKIDDSKTIRPVLNKILPIVYDSQKTSPDFNVKLPSIIGYTINFSILQGESISFFIHNEYKVKVDVFRLGRNKTFLESVGSIDPFIQSSNFSPIKGFDWSPSLNINTKDLKPGYYLVELASEENSSSYQIPFIVKSGKAERIAFVAGTNTWNAYNDYAGLSFYDDRQTPDDFKIFNDTLNKLLEFNNASQLPVHLPFARPFSGPFAGKLNAHAPAIKDDRPESPHHSHLMRSEWTLLAFAEENNLVYSIFTDRDVASKSKLFDAEVIVFKVPDRGSVNPTPLGG